MLTSAHHSLDRLDGCRFKHLLKYLRVL